MNRMYKILIVLNLVLVSGLGGVYFFGGKQKKNAYVQIGKLYKEFKMTKELEGKFTAVGNARKSFLDSLELKIRSIAGEGKNETEFNKLKEEYVQRKQQFEQDNAAMNQQYNTQIMEQMNQYITDYGAENGYAFIFGANGNGGIMYADEKAFDVTQPVLEYINSKYNGHAK